MPVTKLRVGYVPEHFSSPLLILGRSAWGAEHLELVSQPSGTGAGNKARGQTGPARHPGAPRFTTKGVPLRK